MIKSFLVIMISVICYAQDEWFFNDMMRGRVRNIEPKKPKVHFHAKSNIYYFDISGDGIEEYLSFEFNDAQVKLEVYDRKKKLLKDFDFEVSGYQAKPYRLLKKQISPTKTLTLIYFFDGKTGYLNKTGSSSLYAMVVEKGDLKNIAIKKISSIFLESLVQGNYKRRLYEVGFKDINNDGQYEVIVKSGSIKKVYNHKQGSSWIGL